MKIKYGIALLITIMGMELSATEPVAYTSIRQVGMGSAGVAVTNTDSALFQNPAILAESDTTFTPLQFQARVGKDLVSVFSDLKSFSKGGSDSAQADLLKKLVPLNIVSGGTGSMSFSTSGFGFGVMSNVSVVGKLSNKVFPSLKLEGIADVAPAVGYGRKFSVFGLDFDLGASAKYIVRNTMYDKITGTPYIELETSDLIKRVNDKTLTDSFKNSFKTTGFGVDLGLLTPFSIGETEGKWGVAVRNIGSTLKGTMMMLDGQSVNQSIKLPMESVIGVSLKPNLPLLGQIEMASDYKMTPSEKIFKGLSMGVEKQLLWGHLSVRGGLHQGYPVAGFGVSLLKCHLDYAYQTYENGTQVGQDPISYHVLQAGIQF